MSSALDDLTPLENSGPDWFRAAFEVPRRSGAVDVDGTPIHYLEWGDPSAPPVLMTHGFLAHARVFAFVAPLLAERFHLVAFDMSGMGDSGSRAVYGDRADEAMAVAEATGLFAHAVKPTFVTHSFGGTVAISAAEQHPDAFRGLIICDLMMMREARMRALMGEPRPKTDPEEKRTPTIYPDLETILGRYRLTPKQPCANDFLFEYMARHSICSEGGGFRWKFDPGILQHDRSSSGWWGHVPFRFAKLELPRAIIHGRRSRLFDAQSAAFVREIGGPEIPIVGIPEAHHHLMLDQPLAFIAALETLLEAWTCGT